MANILIMGMGEIGRSIYKLYTPLKVLTGIYTIYYKDLKEVKNISNITPVKDLLDTTVSIDVLHVSIPYTNTFIKDVTDVIKTYRPITTFIHSTIDVGTTRKVFEETKANIVHSPVMGLHPDLTESILTFRKIVGPINVGSEMLARKHLKELGIKIEVYKSPEDSEASKMLSTSYYGTMIRFMQEVHDFCEENNLDFDEVYGKTNDIYNEGYTKLGLNHVIRPVLKYNGRGIGGHCVWENAKILSENSDKNFIKNIVDEGKNKLKGGLASKERGK